MRFALEVSMEWVPLSAQAGIDLGFEGAGPGDDRRRPDRLRELINNLIDNAVRYSQHGRAGDGAVAIADAARRGCRSATTGPSIPVEERSASSSASTACWARRTDGSGLGLAIVSEIAALHGARITLEDDVDGVGNTLQRAVPAPQRRHRSPRTAMSSWLTGLGPTS
jgi:two-component system sensor histidine kinase TctE